VATDLDRGHELWLSRGSLFDAIRASIAVPTVFRPHLLNGRRLVDGAMLNPVPVTPLIGSNADYLVAVSMDGAAETIVIPPPEESMPQDEGRYGHRISEFIGRLIPHGESTPHAPGTLETLNQAMDLMQANLSRLRLAVYEPDLLIELPRNIATVYEFYRARELIERGRAQARKALAEWPPSSAPVRSE
jgi:NTE family protein